MTSKDRPVPISELEMPKAVILRRIKHAIEGKPVQKEAKLALARIVTVFISYLTTHALGESSELGRTKTITATMLQNALDRIGFTHLEEEINARMQRNPLPSFKLTILLGHWAYRKQRARQKASVETMEVEVEDEEDDDEGEGEGEEDFKVDVTTHTNGKVPTSPLVGNQEDEEDDDHRMVF